MNRRLPLLVPAVPLLLALASVAVADPVGVVGTPPPGWSGVHHDCADKAGGSVSDGFLAPQFGPVNTGASYGSIAIHAASSDVEGFEKGYPTFSQLAELAASVYQPPGSAFAFRITVETLDGARALVWVPTSAGFGFEGEPVQLNGTQFTIHDADDAGTTFGTTTIEAYQQDHPDAAFTVGLVSWGCQAGDSTVYVDTARVVVNGIEEHYDFEPEPSTVTIARDKRLITSGQKVTLSSTVSGVGGPISGGELDLIRIPAFGGTQTVHAALDGDGVATRTDRPVYNTAYYWRYNGGGVNAPDISDIRKVDVRSKVTAALVDATVRKGERIRLTGTVSPHWNNLRVTLWRATSTGKVKLGSTRTNSSSRFRVRSSEIATTNSATWKVFVTVPPTDDNVAGRSPTRSVQVN